MVSRPPVSSLPKTMLTIGRWNAMLDPGQYKIEDRYLEWSHWEYLPLENRPGL